MVTCQPDGPFAWRGIFHSIKNDSQSYFFWLPAVSLLGNWTWGYFFTSAGIIRCWLAQIFFFHISRNNMYHLYQAPGGKIIFHQKNPKKINLPTCRERKKLIWKSNCTESLPGIGWRSLWSVSRCCQCHSQENSVVEEEGHEQGGGLCVCWIWTEHNIKVQKIL